MKEVVRMSGFRELDKALGELPKATARNVLKRTLVKAAQPTVDEARRVVPVDKGDLRDSIAASAKLKNRVGNTEYAAAMRAGLGRGAALSAMRDARRAAGGGSFAELYVGPGPLPHAHMVEFGTVKMAARPYLRPAWEATKRQALSIIRTELGQEIIKAARRLAKSKRATDAVKARAAIAEQIAGGDG